MALERLMCRSGKDSADRPATFGSGPVDNLKFSGVPVSLVYYDPGDVFPCRLFPCLKLHCYNYSV